MQVPTSVLIMQVLRLYCNYLGGTFCCTYVEGSFCCSNDGECFCCNYAVRSFCKLMQVKVSAANMSVTIFMKLGRQVGVSLAIMQVVLSTVHYHSGHWGINPPSKTPPLSCQAPLKSTNCPSPPF